MSKISVIMPVYNTIKYLPEAVDSILNQTFKDFEFIIIDDGSTDGSFELLEEYAKKDKRIRLFRNEENIGVVKTRNKLLSKISKTSKYIAVMDSDDISDVNRLQYQYTYLENNKHISVVGSDINIIDELGNNTGYRIYPRALEIKKYITKKSPIAQPVSMIRKSSFDAIGGYNDDFERCQDYELWFRFFDAGYGITNIDKKLLSYRVFGDQGKSKYLKLTIKNTLKIQSKYLFTRKYFTIGAFIYHIALRCLYVLPNSLILYLFKKFEYKDEK